MITLILSFLLGDVLLQTMSHLPTKLHLVIFLLLNITVYLLLHKKIQFIYLLISIAVGFAYTSWYAQHRLDLSLPANLENKPILISGYIASLPVTNLLGKSFLLEQSNHSFLRLTWQTNINLHVGDKWQLRVRLKRIHGIQSPGAFDYEAWALENDIQAAGYVLADFENKLLRRHTWHDYPINQLRQLLQQKIIHSLPHSDTSPWLMALIIGEREHIPHVQWQVLRNTGTNHLMAIGGLHIGLIAGFMHVLVKYTWRSIPKLSLLLPATEAGAYAALFIAIMYSALAGLSLPTQRACLMLAILIFVSFARRQINPWLIWAWALFLVLVCNPLSVLNPSFWLSFATIALIIYAMQARLEPKNVWWKWGRVQWIIGVGLIPFTLLFFQESSLISFVANSIAIVWLSVGILPLCFFAGCCLLWFPALGNIFLLTADKSLAGLWQILSWLSQLHFASWQLAMPNQFIFLLTIIGIVLLLLPASFPGKYLGLVWLLPLALFKPLQPKSGEVWLSILDVGQGLSIVTQTTSHVLVFDTGPKFGNSMDMGENVVVPFLRAKGIHDIDAMIISHGDNDHIGGLSAIQTVFPIKQAYSSVPNKLTIPAEYCFAGRHWQWDKVNFQFLYPYPDTLNLNNDSSCVLQIKSEQQTILLTGDIEKYAENVLLKNAATHLSATILIAPHHGSKTSGVKKFISAIHPDWVIYSTGYHNRYHFPNKQVMQTYADLHAQTFNTATTGTLQIHVTQKNRLIDQYRKTHHHYWFANIND